MMKKMNKMMLALVVAAMSITAAQAEHVVIIAANDTHSQIEPASDGQGGVMRRRAIYDQLRRDNKNTLLVHAGDAVQGTVYFSLYGGEVEYALMDSLGYDMIVIGNHEFDNGLDSVAHYYRNVKAKKLSVNYDFSGTAMEGLFEPYIIKAYGDKRVAFFGINVTPEGLISAANYAGMRYVRSLDAADATARFLKEVIKVDYAIMISHIGYNSYDPSEPNDVDIIKSSHYIDMVIGGHSHTVVKPGTEYATVANADGRPIVVGQNGKSGKFVATYDLDLETGKVVYNQIPVNDKWDEAARSYPAMEAWLNHYKHGVDSLMNNVVGTSVRLMKNSGNALQNWVSDAAMKIIPALSGVKDVQFAIMNKGGIRTDMPQGTVTEGLINSMFPFDNRFMVLEINGQDLLDALKVMASRGGDAVSKELQVTYNDKGEITSAKVKGKKVNPKKTYRMVTIDYLANGGDYMVPLKNATRLYVDDVKYGVHILDYVKKLSETGKMIDSTDECRMQKK
ncbi:MAG: bifunctional metallophosphatase/5'-nucleotidase [Muribaculaceae bacterium]|nr:bifunctional metallophosphatase/5'-nucleotidase [Muribaculaceae bacterium]